MMFYLKLSYSFFIRTKKNPPRSKLGDSMSLLVLLAEYGWEQSHRSMNNPKAISQLQKSQFHRWSPRTLLPNS